MQSVTLKQAKESYVRNLENKGKAEITVKVYGSIVEKMIASFKGDKTVDKIIVPHVHQVFKVVDNSGQSEVSVRRNKRVFCQFLEYAQEQGWIGYFPVPNSVKRTYKGSKTQIKSFTVIESNEKSATVVGQVEEL
jgi:site-specific recombinase XerD